MHWQLGHAGKEVCKNTVKYYGWRIEGNYKDCKSCLKGKAHQKKMNKETSSNALEKGERLFIDITPIKHKSYGGSKNWLLVVNNSTDYCWSFFRKTKDKLKDRMATLIRKLLKREKVKVKNIRMDNAGKNLDFKRLSEEEFP